MSSDTFSYGSKQFGLWRAAFGAYLVYFYCATFPYARELFSHEGAFPDVTWFHVGTFFPHWLLRIDSVFAAQAVVAACVACSVLIAIGWARRAAALALWLLILWLYNRNPFTDSPEYEFVNWLVFACIFIPVGEGFSLSSRDPAWRMPKEFYWGAWIVLAAGYLYAGLSKFKAHDAQWLNGTALYYVLATDNSRLAWYGNFFGRIPRILFVPLTWGALCLQTGSPLFVALRKARPWWWLVATSTHVCLLFFVHLTQLTLGMIFFHVFLLDGRWIESARRGWSNRV